MKHYARVDEHGVAHLVNRELMLRDIASYKSKEIVITVEKNKDQRSSSQNRYYWGFCIQLATIKINELGNEYTENDTHEMFKSLFLTVSTQIACEETGELIYEGSRVKSTTDLNSVEFSDYIEKITRWCAEYLDLNISNYG